LISDIGLHRFSVFLAVCTLVLLFVGGLVTSTGSGLAVPDWPLSFGQVFPEMVGGVLYEHGHRLVAATVGFLTIVLVLWTLRRERRLWVRRVALGALAAVICQGILGGVTVLFLLPLAVSVSHAALAEIFFCITVTMAVVTSPGWCQEPAAEEDPGKPSLRILSLLTTGVIYIQILIGALVRHTSSGLAIPDFPLSYGRLIPPFFTRQIVIHFIHRIGALVVGIMVLWLVREILRRQGSDRRIRTGAFFLSAILSIQILLGALTIWSSRNVIVTTLHLAGGAVTLAASLYLTLWLHRRFSPSSGRVAAPVREAAGGVRT